MIPDTTIINFDSAHIEKRVQKKCNLSNEETKEALLEYKRFLYLFYCCYCCNNDQKQQDSLTTTTTAPSLVPGPLVDEFWHDHILHSKQYYDDCHRMFGCMMHHFPSENEEGECADDTMRLYEEIFQCKAPAKYWFDGKNKDAPCCGNGGGTRDCRTGNCKPGW